MINKVILEGRLTKDPELKHYEDDIYTNFTLAVPRNFLNANKERDADFILCTAWGERAERIVNYLSKGKMCSFIGRLQVRTVEKDDKTNWITEVIVEEVHFLDKRDSPKSELPEGTDSDSHSEAKKPKKSEKNS